MVDWHAVQQNMLQCAANNVVMCLVFRTLQLKGNILQPHTACFVHSVCMNPKQSCSTMGIIIMPFAVLLL